MEENGSFSDDSGSSEGASNPAVQCLERFTGKVSEFSQPNLAKALSEITELSEPDTEILKALISTNKDDSYINLDTFISIIQESSDIRSFRVLFGQHFNCPYDYSLICLDIYFHSLDSPSIVLRSGYPEANLSLIFTENGSLPQSWLSKILYSKADAANLYSLFYELHSSLLMSELQLESLTEFTESGAPQAEVTAQLNFLKYACVKYGILENLKNPMPEFAEAIEAYFIIFKENVKMMLEMYSSLEEIQVKIPEDTLTYARNPSLMKLFAEKTYNLAQIELYAEVKSLLDALPTPKERFGINFGSSAVVVLNEASQNDPQPPESSTIYFQTLKDLRFSNFNFWASRHHALQSSADEGGNFNTNRLGKEVKVLSQHLPCEMTGAIFVVMDSERMDLMKALISGSEDTPYTHGLFEFHIACPQEYPKKPPLVSIVTTGGGMVRFNPNLYDDGYVCLSVINTWDGDPSERWNPAHSNILQVLLSIQVLVMDNMIIQKEPEFESYAEDSWENRLYCNIVRYNNVKYAMLGMLDNPPEEFKDVIIRHFALKRNIIMHTVDKWLEQGKDFLIPNEGEIDYLVMDHNPHTCTLFKSYSYYSMLLEARNELLKKLDALPTFGIPKEEFSQIEITEDLAKLGGYYQKMNKFMLVDKKFTEAGGYRHSLAIHLPPASKYNEKSERFLKEKEAFETLKCLPDSSVFIVRDKSRYDLLKVLISGPIGTDYANGLFLFEIACPEDFPDSPPKVALVTTGRFTVNFHPRLQKTGEVSGLSWNSSMTLADLFKQLQDIFKLPHWFDNSALQSAIIKYNTYRYAILDMLEYPPIEFKAAVTAHFEIKRRDVLMLGETAIEEFSSIDVPEGFICENQQTLEVFNELTVSGALENMYSEIVQIIGESGEKWSDCSENDEGMEKKQKKKVKYQKNADYSSYSDSDSKDSALSEKAIKAAAVDKKKYAPEELL